MFNLSGVRQDNGDFQAQKTSLFKVATVGRTLRSQGDFSVQTPQERKCDVVEKEYVM
jgi:hypothetical protein